MKNGNGKKVRAGHTSATELFRGMEVTINFHKGIQVKDSIQSSLPVYLTKVGGFLYAPKKFSHSFIPSCELSFSYVPFRPHCVRR